MTPVKKLLTVAAAGLFGALLLPRITDAQAPVRPESTLTITEPTEIPGKVLEPGSYIVHVSDTQSSWNVIEFRRVDSNATVATVLATPHTAKDSAPHSLFVFFQTPEGQPKALRSWFPPNDRFGQDFVYSKQRGEELARVTKESVPEATAEMTEYEKTHPIASQTTETTAENQKTTTYSSTADNTSRTDMSTTTAQNDTGSTWKTDTGTKSDMQTQTTPAPETTTAENETSTKQELPRTASPFPLLALGGLSALGLGLAVRRYAA